MSYLLTEVAMEMLGWRFYDEDGVPRPINFEGPNNLVCEGVENLAVSLMANPNIAAQNLMLRVPVVPAASNVQAEADSSGQTSQQAEDDIIIDLDGDSPVSIHNGEIGDDNSNGTAMNSNQIEPSETSFENSNISNSPLKPFDLKIERVRGSYDASCEEKIKTTTNMDELNSKLPIDRVTSAGSDVETNRVVLSVNQTPSDSVEPMEEDEDFIQTINDSDCQNQIDDFIDLTNDDQHFAEIEYQLNMEINKISNDLKRQKLIFYESIPNVLKHPISTYQDVLKSYRDQEYRNLQTEYKTLLTLCQEAERIAYVQFEHTYPQYSDISEKLSKVGPIQDFYSNGTSDINMPSTSATKERKQVARKKTSPMN